MRIFSGFSLVGLGLAIGGWITSSGPSGTVAVNERMIEMETHPGQAVMGLMALVSVVAGVALIGSGGRAAPPAGTLPPRRRRRLK
jgi:hypothetical protein